MLKPAAMFLYEVWDCGIKPIVYGGGSLLLVVFLLLYALHGVGAI